MKKKKWYKRIPWWETDEPFGVNYFKGWFKRYFRKSARLNIKKDTKENINAM